MILDPVAVFVALAAVVYAALRLEERFAACRSLGSALVAILLALVLSNIGVLPAESTTYELLMDTGVNVAIALILLGVDVRSIAQAGGKMLAAFALGALGSAIGSSIAALVLHLKIGGETWKLAGMFTGTYIGGQLNFAALARGFETSGDLTSAAVGADVVVSTVWFATCLVIPVFLRGSRQVQDGVPPSTAGPSMGGEERSNLASSVYSSGREVSIADAAASVVIAVGSLWLSKQIGVYVPQIPQVLWLTSITLLAAQLPFVRRLAGSAVWGNYLLLLFLASNGAVSVIATIFRVGPAVFYFAALAVALHGLVLFGIGRLLDFEVSTLVVASQANIGGPATALAVASARGYSDQVLPGMAMGLLGYAIGTYAGFVVSMLLRGWLPG